MLDMITAARYLTDRHETILLDIGVIWGIWNMVEFSWELKPIPVYPIQYHDAQLYFSGDKLATVRGSFFTEHNLPIEADSFIVINTVLLAELPLDGSYVNSSTLYHKIAETLLHEMAHQWCHQNGIADCEPGGVHNAAFRDAARAHGLVCHGGCQGWNKTYVRRGHWGPFYEVAKEFDRMNGTTLAHKMRATHIKAPMTEGENL